MTCINPGSGFLSPRGSLNRRRTERTLAPETPPGRKTAEPTEYKGSSSTGTLPLPGASTATKSLLSVDNHSSPLTAAHITNT